MPPRSPPQYELLVPGRSTKSVQRIAHEAVVARRPPEEEQVYLDCGRRTTLLMRRLGGAPPSILAERQDEPVAIPHDQLALAVDTIVGTIENRSASRA